MSSPRSALWEYFKRTEHKKIVTCVRCKKEVAISGNTTNMKIHMKRHHPLLFYAMEKESAKAKANPISGGDDDCVDIDPDDCPTPTTSESPAAKSPSPCPSTSKTSKKTLKQSNLVQYSNISAQTQDNITNALVYFVAVDLLPYSIVEKKGFNHYMKVCVPSYKIPSRKSLSEKKIPALYQKVREIIQIDINEALYISITTDSWTSVAQEPYVSVTAHFINNNWEMKSACLACRHMAQDQTGSNLAEIILEILAEWQITLNKIAACTTDNGANVLLAAKTLKFNHISCFGHSMNTAVTKSFQITVISSGIDKCKKIQMAFSHSYKINQKLKAVQENMNLPIRKFPSFSATRWWSLLKLLEACTQQHIALISLLSEYRNGKYKSLILTQLEVEMLAATIKYMKEYETISSHMASETTITSSVIVPVLKQIVTKITETSDISQETDPSESEETQNLFNANLFKQLGEPILNTLKKRYYDNTETYSFLKKAMFRDPRFKDNEASLELIKAELKEEMLNLCADSDVELEIKPKKLKGLALILNQTRQSKQASSSLQPVERIRHEVEAYMKCNSPDVDDDPLVWWKQKEIEFPNCAKLAKKYLSAQATSVPSERVFSRGGLIIEDQRASLTSEHAEQLVFLSMNNNYIVL